LLVAGMTAVLLAGKWIAAWAVAAPSPTVRMNN
jgi:hypothetical protein